MLGDKALCPDVIVVLVSVFVGFFFVVDAFVGVFVRHM